MKTFLVYMESNNMEVADNNLYFRENIIGGKNNFINGSSASGDPKRTKTHWVSLVPLNLRQLDRILTRSKSASSGLYIQVIDFKNRHDWPSALLNRRNIKLSRARR